MVQVDQRKLGASGIAVPAMGIGAWSWGEKGMWGYGKEYGRDDIERVYNICVEAGLNFFDTAEVYGQGESERLLGQCFREDQRSIIIASKFAPLPNRFSPHRLLDALDRTLERLGVPQIDLYQIHWPYTFLSVHGLMDALAEAVREGKVRAVGVSNYSADMMRKAYDRLARHDIPLASNQVHYSLLHRKPEANGVLDVCRELNIALIAYSPLEQGLLTGKFRAGDKIAQLPFQRRMQKNFRPAQQQLLEPLLQVMDEVAQAHEKTLGQVALSWLLEKDECIIPIPGAKSASQALENAGAIGWHLTPDEHKYIAQAAEPWLSA
ncbi:MAG TPA: aldo/keto reductase [Dictyobacter sp.]|jgi:aryl-alcohol dehydrogenase-like predicted oxidoreductase|nr:aldo/keto reductase [Dictyobacter sp.]